MDVARERGELGNAASWSSTNARSPTVPWPGHDGARRQRDEPLHGGRPVQREAVAEARRRAVLEQVAREEHLRVGHEDADVAVRVAAPVVGELDDRSPTSTVARSSNVRSGGSMHDLGQSARRAPACSSDTSRMAAGAVAPEPLGGPHVAPDRRGPEDAVAERVIPVPVGVDDDRDRVRASALEARRRSRGRAPAEARVSTRRTSSPTEHDADLLVEEVEVAGEDAVADLGPRHGAGMVRGGDAGAAYALADDRRRTGRARQREGRHVPPGPALARRERASRGPRCCSSTASPSTAGATSTSAAQVANAGIDAHSFDVRGFGGSGGPRASVERWSQLHDDLEERVVAIRSIAPGRPLVLYGHSLGGLIALGYVLDGRAQPDLAGPLGAGDQGGPAAPGRGSRSAGSGASRPG